MDKGLSEYECLHSKLSKSPTSARVEAKRENLSAHPHRRWRPLPLALLQPFSALAPATAAVALAGNGCCHVSVSAAAAGDSSRLVDGGGFHPSVEAIEHWQMIGC